MPSGYTVSLPGAVDSAPDLDTGGVKNNNPDSEGKIQNQGEKGKDAGTIATTAGIGKSAWLKDPDGNTLALFQPEI